MSTGFALRRAAALFLALEAAKLAVCALRRMDGCSMHATRALAAGIEEVAVALGFFVALALLRPAAARFGLGSALRRAATVTAFAVSFFQRETALVPRRFVQAMEAGTTGMLNVAATCASAGIIVGVVAKTGLGLKFSAIVLDFAPPAKVSVLWRKLGEKAFSKIDLAPVRQTFYGSLSAVNINGEDIEYYIEAQTNGGDTLRWPPTAPDINHAVVINVVQ